MKKQIILREAVMRRWRFSNNDRLIRWVSRDGNEEWIGIGVADERVATSMAHALEMIRKLTVECQDGRRYFGGVAFDGERCALSDEWGAFGVARFVRPQYLYHRVGETWSIEDGIPADDVCVDSMIPNHSMAKNERDSVEHMLPDCEGWTRLVRQALLEIRMKQFEKVVLARRLERRWNVPLLVTEVFDALEGSAGSARFLFQLTNDHAFLGASPERLFRRVGRQVETESLAGSRPRGKTDEEDRQLEAALVASSKEKREHEAVRAWIISRLNPLCESIDVDDGDVVKLAYVQHLHHAMRGHLRDEVNDADVMAALHPTPAVCGVPQDNARKWLAAREPFDRGWYSGVVGWIGPDASEFVVAIRSALVYRQRLYLYAGAGIVEGSDPFKEWDETTAKMQTMETLFKT